MIEPTFWSDRDFDHIDIPEPLLVYLYLISNPDCPSTGAYRLSLRTAATHLRMTPVVIRAAIDTLGNRLSYDPCTGWIWVRGYFSRQFKSLPHHNLVKNVAMRIDELRQSDFPFMKDFECKHLELLMRFESAYKELAKDLQRMKGKGKGKGKERGKEKEKDSIEVEFESIWKVYPDKTGKTPALNAFRSARTDDKFSMDEIAAGLARYINYVHRRQCTDFPDLKFKNGATWFRQQGWRDEYETIAPAPKPEIPPLKADEGGHDGGET
jgi:hypothetical protein